MILTSYFMSTFNFLRSLTNSLLNYSGLFHSALLYLWRFFVILCAGELMSRPGPMKVLNHCIALLVLVFLLIQIIKQYPPLLLWRSLLLVRLVECSSRLLIWSIVISMLCSFERYREERATYLFLLKRKIKRGSESIASRILIYVLQTRFPSDI